MWTLRERYPEARSLLAEVEKFQTVLQKIFHPRHLISSEEKCLMRSHLREIERIWQSWQTGDEVYSWSEADVNNFVQQWARLAFTFDWIFFKEFDFMEENFVTSTFQQFKLGIDYLAECLVKGTKVAESKSSDYPPYGVIQMLQESGMNPFENVTHPPFGINICVQSKKISVEKKIDLE